MARLLIPALLSALLLSPLLAHAAAPVIEPKTPRAMSDDDMAEIVDFVVGNAVFALYHQAGHMLMDRYEAMPKGFANTERAADLFAVTTLLDPRSGAGDQTLIDAVDSFKLARPDTVSIADAVGGSDRHALDADRTEAIICDMVGADKAGFSDVADAAGLDAASRTRCAATWKREHAAWQAAIQRVPRAKDGKSEIAVVYEEADDAEGAAATILEDNGVLEEVADRLTASFAFATPPSLHARNCGMATALYDPKANQLVLCYELSADHARLIMRDIERRN